MSRVPWLSAGAVAIALMALPTPATAAGAASHELLFKLSGSNGYKIAVRARGATAFVRVMRPVRSPVRSAAASFYIARAQVSATRLRAEFGKRGSIAVRFRPSGKVTRSKPRRHCRGPDRFTRRFGVFVGKIRFVGEDRYTSARRQRARGRVLSPLFLRCEGPGFRVPRPKRWRAAAARRQHRVTSLRARWRLGLSAASFAAVRAGARKARFFATAEESKGPLAVFRLAFAQAPAAAFTADNALSLASVKPPAPFSGSGSFQRNANGFKSWTGSLTVSFPGARDVPLTGPQFKTQLFRSW